MARKASFFARLIERFTRYSPSLVRSVDTRNILLDGVSEGIGEMADALDVFADHQRFLATARGKELALYAADRDTERGLNQSDLAFRIILCNWYDYVARRGTYRGTAYECLWRFGSWPQVRSPMMSVAIKTGLTTPLGLNTCAIQALGVRLLYYAPATITANVIARTVARLIPLNLHHSLRRLSTTTKVPGTDEYEFVTVGEAGTFAGTATGFSVSDKLLVAVDNTASYVSAMLALPVTVDLLDDYSWTVAWRAYEAVAWPRTTVQIKWYTIDSSSDWTTVTCGQTVTPMTGAIGISFKVLFDAGDSLDTQNLGTVTAGAGSFSGQLTLFDRPIFVTVTDGGETFVDLAGSGVLVGDAGGSGTVNYVTGNVLVTFGGGGSVGGTLTARLWNPMCFDKLELSGIHWNVK